MLCILAQRVQTQIIIVRSGLLSWKNFQPIYTWPGVTREEIHITTADLGSLGISNLFLLQSDIELTCFLHIHMHTSCGITLAIYYPVIC